MPISLRLPRRLTRYRSNSRSALEEVSGQQGSRYQAASLVIGTLCRVATVLTLSTLGGKSGLGPSDIWATGLQAGVASRLKSGGRGNFVEQGDELTASGGVQYADHLRFELVGGLLGAREHLPPHGRETNRVSSPVTRVGLAFDKSVLLKFVEEPNHGIAVEGQRVGQLLLGLTIGECELAEDSEVARVQP
jgi:hypothetical protein